MQPRRIALNPATVREIRALAPSFAEIVAQRGVKSRRSREVALLYGIDAKTVRDVWNHRSWERRMRCNEAIQDALVVDLLRSLFDTNN